ncbi:tripartite tricarboxylate transporter TctB family protein [Caldalkalibacillus salinus]|uniref:tripartite tricarboxylate transporter TctB family protein n=1 Tax=Caldalkalibacillus salinus TaxID=2803787 RepID=UPI0019208A01|nr:tripartite tricarboxylate transporter TctB family protein [Caldalkalibacillus salinus]
MMVLKTPNRVMGIIFFLLSIAYLLYAFNIPQFNLTVPVDSDLFPKVLGFMLLVLSFALFFEKDRTEKATVSLKEDQGRPQTDQKITESDQKSTDSTDEGVYQAQQKNHIDHDANNESISRWQQPYMQVICTVLFTVLYIALFERLGFILSTGIFLFGTTYFFGYRRHLINLAVALSVSLIFYFVLTKALNIYLPQGPLTI